MIVSKTIGEIKYPGIYFWRSKESVEFGIAWKWKSGRYKTYTMIALPCCGNSMWNDSIPLEVHKTVFTREDF